MRSILFAGHETTSGSICIMMHFVSRHPEVLEKLREEQLELVERYGTTLTPEILEGTYTEAVTVEVAHSAFVSYEK
jgi:cytochrome P450